MRINRPKAEPDSRSFAAGAEEGCDAKVKENRYNNGRGNERAVIGSVHPAYACAPNRGREDQDRKQEEDAGDLEPENAADALEWAQEIADTLGDAAADTGCGFSGRRPGWQGGCNLRWWCGLCCCQALAGDASNDAEPDAEDAADLFRSHPVYDGSSDSAAG